MNVDYCPDRGGIFFIQHRVPLRIITLIGVVHLKPGIQRLEHLGGLCVRVDKVDE